MKKLLALAVAAFLATGACQASKVHFSGDTMIVVDGDDTTSKADDDQPEWFKKFKAETDKKLTALVAENESLKAEKQKAERSANITATAKRLGIPDFLMKRFAIADDADIEKELTEYKQDLITNQLMPSTEASITSSSEQAAKDDAEAWAKKLPDL